MKITIAITECWRGEKKILDWTIYTFRRELFEGQNLTFEVYC